VTQEGPEPVTGRTVNNFAEAFPGPETGPSDAATCIGDATARFMGRARGDFTARLSARGFPQPPSSPSPNPLAEAVVGALDTLKKDGSTTAADQYGVLKIDESDLLDQGSWARHSLLSS